MLTHRIPYPPDRGDRIRAYHILQHLNKDFDVWLGCTTDEPYTELQREELRRLTVDHQIQPINARYGKLCGIRSLCFGGAVTPAYFYRRKLARTIVDWHQSLRFDALFTFCTGMVNYARDVLAADRKMGGEPLRHIIDLVDVDSEKWREYSEKSKAPMRWIYRAESNRLRHIESG